MSRIGIVVVTWNSADVIGECLDASLGVEDARVVVVDNASEDDTVTVAAARPGVELVRNPSNLGFAAAANQGVRAAGASTVLLLNPDATLLTPVHDLVRALEQPGVGAAAGRLIGADGRGQDGFNVRALPSPLTLALEVLGINRVWPSNPVNRRYRAPAKHAASVEQPAGAFLMIRREAWDSVGGFDERFFPAWFEDVDFCKRLREGGWQIRYVPEVVARHQGGNSANKIKWGDRQVFWYENLLRYAAKHYTCTGRATVALAVMVAAVLRTLYMLSFQYHAGAVSVYSRVFKLAWLHLRAGNRGSERHARASQIEERQTRRP